MYGSYFYSHYSIKANACHFRVVSNLVFGYINIITPKGLLVYIHVHVYTQNLDCRSGNFHNLQTVMLLLLTAVALGLARVRGF